MFWWIVLAVILIVVVGCLAIANADQTPKKTMEDYWAEDRPKEEFVDQSGGSSIGIFEDSVEVERERVKKNKQESSDKFHNEFLRGLPFVSCRSQGRDAVISIDEDRNEIIALTYKVGAEGHVVLNNKCIAISDIIKLDVIQLKKTISVDVESYVPVVVTKKKSAIGRAAVGAVVLGPVGAIVGAISAVPATSVTENQKVISSELREVNGDIVLSIWEKNSLLEPYKFIFSTNDAALSMKYRIESMM